MCNGCRQTSTWLLLRHRVSVAVEKLRRLFRGSSEPEVLLLIMVCAIRSLYIFVDKYWLCIEQTIPRQTDIAIAIPLSKEAPLSTFPVYAFLPIRSTEFQFLLNGKTPLLRPEYTNHSSADAFLYFLDF